MALSEQRLNDRFIDNPLLDHGGLPPLPPITDYNGGQDGRPEQPPSRYSLLGDFAVLIAVGLGGAAAGTAVMYSKLSAPTGFSYHPKSHFCDESSNSDIRSSSSRLLLCGYKAKPKF